MQIRFVDLKARYETIAPCGSLPLTQVLASFDVSLPLYAAITPEQI